MSIKKVTLAMFDFIEFIVMVAKMAIMLMRIHLMSR